MTILTDAQTRSTTLAADGSAVPNARRFARDVLAVWLLSDLEANACAGLSELVTWAVANDPAVFIEITLIWDGPLLFTEVADRRGRLPSRPTWLVEDQLGVILLERSSLEWGAELNARGRCLWASFHTGRPEVVNQEPV